MNKKDIKRTGKLLGLIYRASGEHWISFNGINGDVFLIFEEKEESVFLRFKEKILQMGRDSLKMELNILLNISLHE